MKIVNDGVPEVIFRAMQAVQYQKKDAFSSATRLLASPRQFWLEKRHDDELEEPASDRLWSLLGTAMHLVVEKGGSEETSEQELEVTVAGQRITGTSDYYKDGVISDFKLTSVWSYIYRADKIPDWEKQLNIYAFMLRRAGKDVKWLQIICLFRDWQKSKYEFESDYPKQIAVIPIRLWSLEEAEEWVTKKVLQLLQYSNTADNELPYCTNEDTWQKPDKYAVMKKGNKRAVKLYEDEASALAHVEQDANFYLEIRKGEPTRCIGYCPMKDICNQHQEYLKEQMEAL